MIFPRLAHENHWEVRKAALAALGAIAKKEDERAINAILEYLDLPSELSDKHQVIIFFHVRTYSEYLSDVIVRPSNFYPTGVSMVKLH